MADLRARREALGLTQRALAVRLDRTPEMVWRYETGRSPVPEWVWNEINRIDWSQRLTKLERKVRDIEARMKA
jgi:predicted transcriptional regulator